MKGGRALLALGGIAFITAIVVGGTSAYVKASGPLDFAGEGVSLAAYEGQDPTGVPPELAQADLVTRGEYLVRAADCAPCHSTPDRPAFSGGRAFKLPFGTIYSANITSDSQFGIGGWSDEQFIAAVRHGRGKDGENLYPAMPYPSFQRITDNDLKAMRAFLATVPAEPSAAPDNQLSFPFSQRWTLGIWNTLFARKEEFAPVAARSPEWNRGAYLAEALGHCAECHTPRGMGFWLDQRSQYAGAQTNGWYAHNLTSDKDSGIGGWSDEQLTAYLATGLSGGRGVASGPMGEAVDHGTSHLTDGDRAALITYLRSVPAISNGAPKRAEALGQGFSKSLDGSAGEQLFAANCAGCHDWTGVSPHAADATLVGLSSLNDGTGINAVQVILYGVDREVAGTGAMPAFGDILTNYEIAQLANYITGRFGREATSFDAQEVHEIRQAGPH